MTNLINQALWETEFSDKPMPEDITMEEFHAAVSVLDKQKHIEWIRQYLLDLKNLSSNANSDTAKKWARLEHAKFMLELAELMEG